ncbi:hypothetical protein [Paracoccus yeei]|uniref:Uncharacterized protein n=1 Tax=Paracoccus yeei TaxID=147645 RepID=A0A5P2QT34_9RHOB|nr:hypothetical protein [Paracoccus yeei]QEU08950.1 hypothetical protein FOB51_13640 [Paracoccus yeei]QEU09559.1 hypothetical protein FOB51_16990 [Paracoccus yeei]
MPTHYLADSVYAALTESLAGAFMRAATGVTDLHSELAEALAVAGVLPEVCREGMDVVTLAA